MASLLNPFIPLIGYLIVWLAIFALAALFKADKHGILAKPYYLMLKTAHFNSWMERIGNKWRRGWLAFFDIGAAMGVSLTALILYVMVNSLFQLIVRSPQASPTVLIVPIPGLAIRWEIFPYILIAIAAVLIPHEVAHGIASVLDNVPIKSSGVFMAVVLPGGFVEIDEEDLAKRRARTKLRVFAAGSFTNVVSAILAIILLMMLFAPTPSGVLVTNRVPGGPAEMQGIPQWAVITAVNGIRTETPQDMISLLNNTHPGDVLAIQLINEPHPIDVTLGSNNNSSRGFLGITSSPYFASTIPFLVWPWTVHVSNTLGWMEIILLGVGLVNMLPLFPFDGDRYFDTILSRVGLKNTKPARTVATVGSLSLLVSNVVLSGLIFGTFLLR